MAIIHLESIENGFQVTLFWIFQFGVFIIDMPTETFIHVKISFWIVGFNINLIVGDNNLCKLYSEQGTE